jgi:hypothetical protein
MQILGSSNRGMHSNNFFMYSWNSNATLVVVHSTTVLMLYDSVRDLDHVTIACGNSQYAESV